MPLEQQVGLVLVPGDLQGVGELDLILARLQAPADAADPADQEEHAEGEAQPRGPGDQPDSPDRVRVGGRVVGAGVVELAPEQVVEVGADRSVGGGQPGRQLSVQREPARPTPAEGSPG